MGLDMYLAADIYIGGYDFSPQRDQAAYTTITEALDLGNMLTPESKGLTIRPTVVYWRKANQIHKWFVDNVQGGNDDCGDYEFEVDRLEELRLLCKRLLGVREKCGVNPDSANKLAVKELPPVAGFFFGGTEVDDYYWQELEYTVKELDRVLAEHQRLTAGDDVWITYVYRSSW